MAENDDRPDDWNFLLFQRLAPGYYTLRVEPVGVGQDRGAGRSAHAGRSRESGRHPPLHGQPPTRQRRAAPPAGGGSQGGPPARRGALEGQPRALQWRPEDEGPGAPSAPPIGREPHLAIPLVEAGRATGYRLRLWSLDRHGTPVRALRGGPLRAAALRARAAARRGSARGGRFRSAPRPPRWSTLDRPGVFRFADEAPGSARLRRAGHPARSAELAGRWQGRSAASSPLPASASGWCAKARGGTVKAERMIIRLRPRCRHAVPGGRRQRGDRRSRRSGQGRRRAGAGPGDLALRPARREGGRLQRRRSRPPAAEPAATQMAVGPRTAMAVVPDLQAGRSPASGRRDGRCPTTAAPGDGASRRCVSRSSASRLRRWRRPVGASSTASSKGSPRAGSPAVRRPQAALSVGEGTVAVLSRGDTVVSTHWQGGAPFEELTWRTTRRTVSPCCTSGPGADPFSVELLPRAARKRTSSP